jgi:hypothetical protein
MDGQAALLSSALGTGGWLDLIPLRLAEIVLYLDTYLGTGRLYIL